MANPKIFYHAYDHQRPTGGQKDTYQHVDVLNRNGREAYIVHMAPGFRLSWFENSTRVIDWATFRSMYNRDRDFMVVPEDLGAAIGHCEGRKVVFNKNIYHGFNAVYGQCADPNLSKDVIAIFAVSEHNRRHLRFAYPDKEIMLVHYDIRSDLFRYRPLRKKQPIVACLPKEPVQVRALMQMLELRASRGVSHGRHFQWLLLADLTERKIAEVLGNAVILVFLSTNEGLPRMPLEAMACGCLVVAYDSPPLTEYLPIEYRFPPGDLVRMAEFVEHVEEAYPDKLSGFDGLTGAARLTSERYSSRIQERSVLDCWQRIVDKNG